MVYEYVLVADANREDELRAIFGVDETALPDTLINMVSNMPAAELEVLDKLPTAASFTGSDLLKVRLAVLYFTAANCLQAVKLNILHIETDNKTSGQRFKDALSLTSKDLREKGDSYISKLLDKLSTNAGKGGLFEGVTPSVDVITGGGYA